MADETWANVAGAVTDFAVAPRSTPPLLQSPAFTLNPTTASGKNLEVVQLIDPAVAADATKSGRIWLMQKQSDGTWVETGDGVPWKGGQVSLVSRVGGTMNPPRVGFIVALGLASDPNAKVNRTLGVRCELKPDGVSMAVGLGHRIF